jgi:hypothetical protein
MHVPLITTLIESRDVIHLSIVILMTFSSSSSHTICMYAMQMLTTLSSEYPPFSSSQLPPNIHLLTTQDNGYYGEAGTMIFRLSHSFEAGEDPVLSLPVTVDLRNLFSSLVLTSCTEMSLTANQPVFRPSDFTCIFLFSFARRV